MAWLYRKKYLLSIIITYALFCIVSIIHDNNDYQFSFKMNNTADISNSIKVENITSLKYLKYNHASSLAVLNNKLYATWYSADNETNPDTKIIMSVASLDGKSSFSEPFVIMDREKYQQYTKKRIHHLGNPSIFVHNNELYVFFTTSSGGWVTSSLNIIHSNNYGKTWSNPKVIINSPILNYSSLTRGSVINLDNDMFALPAYKEFNNLAGRWLVFDKNSNLVYAKEMTNNGVTLQPTVIPLSNKDAIAFYREMHSTDKKIYANETHDGGKTWVNNHTTKLNNPDAGIAGIKTKNGSLLAYNDSTINRENLTIAYRDDNLGEWKNIYTFDNPEKNGRSYPFFITNGSDIYLSYSIGKEQTMNINVAKITGENNAY
jgi:predicted neuraminidase